MIFEQRTAFIGFVCLPHFFANFVMFICSYCFVLSSCFTILGDFVWFVKKITLCVYLLMMTMRMTRPITPIIIIIWKRTVKIAIYSIFYFHISSYFEKSTLGLFCDSFENTFKFCSQNFLFNFPACCSN